MFVNNIPFTTTVPAIRNFSTTYVQNMYNYVDSSNLASTNKTEPDSYTNSLLSLTLSTSTTAYQNYHRVQ